MPPFEFAQHHRLNIGRQDEGLLDEETAKDYLHDGDGSELEVPSQHNPVCRVGIVHDDRLAIGQCTVGGNCEDKVVRGHRQSLRGIRGISRKSQWELASVPR